MIESEQKYYSLIIESNENYKCFNFSTEIQIMLANYIFYRLSEISKLHGKKIDEQVILAQPDQNLLYTVLPCDDQGKLCPIITKLEFTRHIKNGKKEILELIEKTEKPKIDDFESFIESGTFWLSWYNSMRCLYL
jgi:hypothetical protein